MNELFPVRTTMRPEDTIEVSEAERLDLQRQGLLLGDVERVSEPQATAGTEPTTDAPRTPARRRQEGN